MGDTSMARRDVNRLSQDECILFVVEREQGWNAVVESTAARRGKAVVYCGNYTLSLSRGVE